MENDPLLTIKIRGIVMPSIIFLNDSYYFITSGWVTNHNVRIHTH